MPSPEPMVAHCPGCGFMVVYRPDQPEKYEVTRPMPDMLFVKCWNCGKPVKMEAPDATS